ncbi:hypothetical protein EMIT0180MI3_11901 [Priestia megaterium]
MFFCFSCLKKFLYREAGVFPQQNRVYVSGDLGNTVHKCTKGDLKRCK